MITEHNLTKEQYQAMLEMLAGLTPAERALLEDPDVITEDEADIIWSDRAMAEDGCPEIPRTGRRSETRCRRTACGS